MNSTEIYHQAVLALEQIIDIHENAIQNLKREIFLLVRLIQIITKNKPDEISHLINQYNKHIQKLLQIVYAHIQGQPRKMEKLLNMQSFLMVKGISFPTI